MKKIKIYPYGKSIDRASTKDVVSKELYEQTKWERDIALSQLEKLGLGLGEKIDGVYLTKEEYNNMLEYMGQSI